MPFARRCRVSGSTRPLRFVDSAQWRERAETFDFDAMHVFIPMSETPGIELRDAFGVRRMPTSAGVGAVSGVANPGIDKLIDMIVRAETREELTVRVRALDRVLRAMHIRVPYWVRPDKPGSPTTTTYRHPDRASATTASACRTSGGATRRATKSCGPSGAIALKWAPISSAACC